MIDPELKELLEAMRQETRQDMLAMREDIITTLREEDRAMHAETRRHFDVVAESLKSDIQGLCEGFEMLNVKIDREIGRLEQKMDDGFAETHSLLRFAYRQLEKKR